MLFSREHDIQPLRQRSEFLGQRLPRVSAHDDRMHFWRARLRRGVVHDGRFPRRQFAKALHIFGQMPRQLVLVADAPILFGRSHNHPKRLRFGRHD